MPASTAGVDAAAQRAEIARAAIEIACAGQLDRIPDFYDPGFVDHVNSMVFRGHAGARESVGFYRSLFPDLRFEVDDQVAEDDRVATRWTLHGTYRGRRVTLHGIVISRFSGDRIVEDHGVADTLELLRGLGALRTAALAFDVLRGRVKLPRGALARAA